MKKKWMWLILGGAALWILYEAFRERSGVTIAAPAPPAVFVCGYVCTINPA